MRRSELVQHHQNMGNHHTKIARKFQEHGNHQEHKFHTEAAELHRKLARHYNAGSDASTFDLPHHTSAEEPR